MPGRRPRPRHRQDHRSGRRAWARRALRCAGVRACGCERGTRRYCRAHYQRLLDRRRDDPGFDERRWHRIEPAIEQPGQVSLHGIPVLVSVRLRYGLQRRTRDGAITDAARLRQIAGELRRRQPVSREQVDGRGDQYKVLRCFVRHVQRAVLDPETERVKDVWDLAAFGLRGNLSFTKITQGWLREAAKRWAADDLPRRRGKDTAGPVRHYLLSLAALSESLRANRPDRGEHPGVLGRGDIEAFPRRLAFLAAEARVSVDARPRICREVRHVLTRMRALGLTRRGRPGAGLGDDFTLTAGDVPTKPEDPEPNRDLPGEIMRQLCAQLPILDSVISCREIRLAVELLIDTGRRPDEICAPRWDCLDYDQDRSPVLVYDNQERPPRSTVTHRPGHGGLDRRSERTRPSTVSRHLAGAAQAATRRLCQPPRPARYHRKPAGCPAPRLDRCPTGAAARRWNRVR